MLKCILAFQIFRNWYYQPGLQVRCTEKELSSNTAVLKTCFLNSRNTTNKFNGDLAESLENSVIIFVTELVVKKSPLNLDYFKAVTKGKNKNKKWQINMGQSRAFQMPSSFEVILI